MNLYIDTIAPAAEPLGRVVIPPEALLQTSTHLFINSCDWDKMFVSLREPEALPLHTLSLVRGKVKEIFVKLPDKVTERALQLLIELFPKLDGKLRKCFITGGDFNEVLLSELWRDGSGN
jgi:hypothetical protein